MEEAHKGAKGSTKLNDTFIAPVCACSSTKPLRTRDVRVFHSIGINSTSIPISRRFSCDELIHGQGEHLVPTLRSEIKKLVLTRLPSSRLAS